MKTNPPLEWFNEGVGIVSDHATPEDDTGNDNEYDSQE